MQSNATPKFLTLIDSRNYLDKMWKSMGLIFYHVMMNGGGW
jgi:hypothetical protein